LGESIFDVFLSVWFVLVALSIVDSLGDLLFWRFNYALGLRVLVREEPTLQPPIASTGTVFETANGKFKVVDPGLVLVRHRYGWMRSRTQVRGRIIWDGGMARMEARVSWITALGPIAMVAFFVMIGIANQTEIIVLIAIVLFGMTGVSAYMSRRQASALMEEYREWSATPVAGRLTSASS